MHISSRKTAAGFALFLFGYVAQGWSQPVPPNGSLDIDAGKIRPFLTSPMNMSPTAGSTGQQNPVIQYYGGQVMGSPNVYLVWYGNWNQNNGSDTPGGQQIIRDFLHGLSGSNYYMTNHTYASSGGTPTGYFNVAREYTDSYSQGRNLNDTRVGYVVARAILYGFLPLDANGVYFVLTSTDVAEVSGFCSQYCGWHTAGTLNGTYVKFAFVGNANRCLYACAAQATGPNGNAGVDGMVSVIAHELEETNTDPLPGSGWLDANGAENGDKCAWTFGQSQSLAPNGAYYNITLPGVSQSTRNYLIQRDLSATDSKCYMDFSRKLQ